MQPYTEVCFHWQTPESWGKYREIPKENPVNNTRNVGLWQTSLLFQRDRDLYLTDEYTVEFLQNEIVKFLDKWTKAQTWIMTENLYTASKKIVEILPRVGWHKVYRVPG